jgi:hypothetical protein
MQTACTSRNPPAVPRQHRMVPSEPFVSPFYCSGLLLALTALFPFLPLAMQPDRARLDLHSALPSAAAAAAVAAAAATARLQPMDSTTSGHGDEDGHGGALWLKQTLVS